MIHQLLVRSLWSSGALLVASRGFAVLRRRLGAALGRRRQFFSHDGRVDLLRGKALVDQLELGVLGFQEVLSAPVVHGRWL